MMDNKKPEQPPPPRPEEDTDMPVRRPDGDDEIREFAHAAGVQAIAAALAQPL